MRFRSTPQEVEAVQWTGDNWSDIVEFLNPRATDVRISPIAVKTSGGALTLQAGKDGAQGWVPVPKGHWIVRNPGDLTDHWPVDPDYFAGKYEPIIEPLIEAVIHAHDCDSVDCQGECAEDDVGVGV